MMKLTKKQTKLCAELSAGLLKIKARCADAGLEFSASISLKEGGNDEHD